MIKSFLNGKFGLAKTYWIGIAGFGVIFQLFNRYITQQYLTTFDPVSVEQIELIHHGGMVAGTIITVVLLRAVFKAATDNRTPGGWGWLAIAIAALGVLNVGYITATLLKPSLPTPRFMLEREINQLQSQLPQVMQPGVTMRSVTVVGGELIYALDMDLQMPDENVEMLENAFKPDTPDGNTTCRDFEGYFRGGLDQITYDYTYINRDVQATLTREECLTFLETE